MDAETDEIVIHYNLGDLRMIAAEFSPDDQTLYLAGEDNNIYVFPSQIPSSVESWEIFE